FTACYSRHQFVWLTVHQTLEEVVEGFERAWEFFGGVFRVVIPDNLKAIVSKADALSPKICDGYLEYAQCRGFVIDPARVRKPDDKPRVERQVRYIRESFFAGESFRDLDEARRRAEQWCLRVAGTRVHGTTQKRPIEVYEAEEKPQLLPAPERRYDVPLHCDVRVGIDHHVRVGRALYSVPTEWIGQHVHVRADRELVQISCRGQLIKTHARVEPGGRSTDPGDYPQEKAIYAMRNATALLDRARSAGESCGAFAEKLLQSPMPWTRMRHVYRLLSLVRTHGEKRVDSACRQALAYDAIDVMRIDRMLERGLEKTEPQRAPESLATVLAFRFQRPREDFMLRNRKEEGDER
ncbi:MAG: Mu transposase domain-containing protein, partial [Sciscionella sp.]